MSKRSEELEAARQMALANLAEITEEEDAAITADALADPDNPPADELMRDARLFLEDDRVPIMLDLDADIVDAFKAQGPGWQTRINDTLRKAVGL